MCEKKFSVVLCPLALDPSNATARNISYFQMKEWCLRAMHLYIGWSDVTVVCGRVTIFMLWGNTAYCVNLSGEDLSRCSSKIESVGLRKCSYYRYLTKASDTLESFLSKVAFESDFRKKTCTCVMKTFAIFLHSKETFTIRTRSILESFFASYFRKRLSKENFLVCHYLKKMTPQ